MRRRTVVTALAAALVPLAIAATTAAATDTSSTATGAAAPHAAKPSTHRLIPAPGQGVLPRRNATVTSSNWSGYAVVTSGVTEVRSTFVVPTLKTFPTGFASTWAGIGGYNTSDLIQAGMAEESPNEYYAWYEILPASATRIFNCVGDASCSVRPGDKAYVRIYQKRGNIWNITIGNTGHGVHWTWVRDIVYASSRSSAEWVLEAPTVGGVQSTLANVGTAYFGPTNVYKANGVLRRIAGGNPVQIVLVQNGIRAARPSPLASDGQRFNDCSYQRNCRAP